MYVIFTTNQILGLTLLRFTSPPDPARGLPAGPSPLTPRPLSDATFILYAGGRRIPSGIPSAGEYRIELD